jgi:hypothetical protein
MKKLILFLILFLCFTLHASAWNPLIIGSGTSGGCYDCSGTARFLWECNSVTVGDTGYSPCGCSDGDTSISVLEGSAAINPVGTCEFTDGGSNGWDYYSWNGSGGEIDPDNYTIFIRFRVNTWKDSSLLFAAYDVSASGNNIKFLFTSSNNMHHLHNTVTGTDALAVLSGNAVATGSWCTVRGRFRASGSNPDIGISVSECGTDSQEDNDNGSDFTESLSTNEVHLGNFSNVVDGDLDVDYIRIYDGWIDTDPNA